MPDLVGDPRLANVNQPSGPNPLHDDDPSNDDQYEAWKANADLWREWAAKQDEAIARLVQQGGAQGQTAEQTLAKAGFKNAKEQGMHAYTMYGTGGYYSQMGAAADPGWKYDWSTGLKYNIGTDDLSARTRGVPINANEYAERAKSQQYAAAGVNDYGMQANSEAFKRAVSAGHFKQDPKTGNYYSGTNPADAGNTWVDKYGRKISGNQGAPTGQSFNGQPLYGSDYGGGGGGGYGSSAFGGGGFTPGSEASAFSQADLNSALAESMRNDVLGQQMQLQKGLEGHALGTSVYDYMLNNVYGKILGVNFQGNPQGVQQYAQGLQTGSPTTYDVAYGQSPTASPESSIAEYQRLKEQQSSTASPESSIAEYQRQKEAQMAGQSPTASPESSIAEYQKQKEAKMASGVTALSRAAPGTTVDPQSQLTGSDLDFQGQPGGLDNIQTEKAVPRDPSTYTPSEAEERKAATPAQSPGYFANVKTNPGRSVAALGTPLPQGSYTETGVKGLNPNMNESWASFLAPTFNQQMLAGDKEQEAIRRGLPRGGAQDQAVSDSIRGRYSSLQNSWQSLVPTALQGVSDIGKEMYFQQPAANSGAAGTAAGIQASNQQYNLGQQQLASNEKIADKQASAAKWGAVGSALGGLTSLISPFKLSDERSKDDVKSYGSDLDDVTKMKPVSYKYNGKMGSKKGQPGVSVMAQDAKKIDPKMTATRSDGAMGVKPMEMLMKTVNSVKELEQIVAQLQQRLG